MPMNMTLKEVLRDLVEASRYKLRVLAEMLGISYSYLANAINPDLPKFEFQLRHCIPLATITEDYRVLDYLEAACGRVAIQLEKGGGDPKQVTIELCKTMKEFGDVAKELAAAMQDGSLSPRERKRIEKETMETVAQMMRFLATVQEAGNDHP